MARENVEIDINVHKRQIEIYSIDLLDFNFTTAKIKVSCKKGTYIRTLVHDIGQKLGCGAYMSDLVRIQAGSFNIENSNNLQDVFCKLNPLDVLNLPKYCVNEQEFEKIKNGNFIENKTEYIDGIILLTKDNKLVSVANLSDNLIKPKKLFKED